MSRPRINPSKRLQATAFTLGQAELDKLDEIGLATGLNRSEIIRSAIQQLQVVTKKIETVIFTIGMANDE